jgi:ADP-heptose:LPS heptosyltransferase
MNKTFKHSGTLGDIVYGLALMKHLGGGEFYLHLGQVDWIGQHYYGNAPDPFHKGRMTQNDFEFMREFMESQDYITKFDLMNEKETAITHNLDRFRPLFVGHPANYITTYCMAFGITDLTTQITVSDGPWLSAPTPRPIPGKPYVVNRTPRGFTSPGCNPTWTSWKDEGIDQQSIFVGLPKEYEDFKQLTGWNIDYHPTKNMLELAEVIAGCEQFMGNQSVALSIAQGLRVPYAFEARGDLPMERNESYFPNHENGDQF